MSSIKAISIMTAKSFKIICLREEGMSLIKIKNSNGPRIEPWGTPKFNSCFKSDLTPLTLVDCFLSFKLDLNYSKAISLMP